MNAVLDTNELLHLIIAEVPHEYRTSLRRVSKNWQTAVEKIGHVLDPIDHHWDFLDDSVYFSVGPIYSLINHFVLEFNPILSAIHRSTGRLGKERVYNIIIVGGLSSAEFNERKREFITIPPLSQAFVATSTPRNTASLRVRGGIRIGDLLEH